MYIFFWRERVALCVDCLSSRHSRPLREQPVCANMSASPTPRNTRPRIPRCPGGLYRCPVARVWLGPEMFPGIGVPPPGPAAGSHVVQGDPAAPLGQLQPNVLKERQSAHARRMADTPRRTLLSRRNAGLEARRTPAWCKTPSIASAPQPRRTRRPRMQTRFPKEPHRHLHVAMRIRWDTRNQIRRG
jgi:hypothetical protein